jgi:hypothetical protein
MKDDGRNYFMLQTVTDSLLYLLSNFLTFTLCTDTTQVTQDMNHANLTLHKFFHNAPIKF